MLLVVPCAPTTAFVFVFASSDLAPVNRAGVSVRARVTAEDGTLHERSATGRIQPSRPEQVALEDALLSLIETHCPP